jgi:hypothetical protein
VNPTPYINFMPPEVIMFGQDRILQAFVEHPPDYIVWVTFSDPADYGFINFQVDYGREIYRWVQENYAESPMPYGPNFPMKLLRKK